MLGVKQGALDTRILKPEHNEIIYPFPNFYGAAGKVWQWLDNFIPKFIMNVITYRCWDQS